MIRMKHPTPIAIFARLTRAVREETMPESVRADAFAIVETLAGHFGQSAFATHLAALSALALECSELQAAIQDHLPALHEMAASAVSAPLTSPHPATP
jgi:hypothetical protein